jgi:hypothetical protein
MTISGAHIFNVASCEVTVWHKIPKKEICILGVLLHMPSPSLCESGRL